MKKANIQTILLVGFSIIILIVLLSGIREIINLNKLQDLNSSSEKLYNDHIYLNESLMLINSDNSLLKSIINTTSHSEFEFLIFEHENNVRIINENYKKTFSDKNKTKELNELYLLLKESNAIYKNEFLKNYLLIIEKKENLLNIDNYYIDNLSINNKYTKAQTVKNFNDEIFDMNSQTDIVFKEIVANFKLTIQKNKQLINTSKESLNSKFKMILKIAVIFFLAIILISFLILSLMIRTVLRPVEKIQSHLDIITQGEFPEDIHFDAGIEIQEMSVSINKLIAGLRRGVDFSLEIGNGNFESDFKPLSDNDVLGNSLLMLRDNLQTAQIEEEKRKTEDAQRNRTNEGLTMFSEILRQQTENISDLADVIISSLVKFMNANQGALFFLNEFDKKNIHYELLGAYAYNRKKYLSKQIKPGEGLIGSVAIEKYTVYMTDLPDEYIEIESGTGNANPRSVIIVPLKIEENVLGVIELASFNLFEEYEIEMVEKIAESIASSLANARINIQTAKLLEQSKDQEKLVLDQEQELSQSFKEIKELTKKIDELTKENESLKKVES